CVLHAARGILVHRTAEIRFRTPLILIVRSLSKKSATNRIVKFGVLCLIDNGHLRVAALVTEKQPGHDREHDQHDWTENGHDDEELCSDALQILTLDNCH